MSIPTNAEERFDFIADLILGIKGTAQPSEIDAYITGSICAGLRPGKIDIKDAFKHIEPDIEMDDETSGILVDFAQFIENQLSEEGFSYEPLIANEDYEVAERLQSLCCWCSNFISGFGLTYSRLNPNKTDADITKDTREGLDDLANMAQIDTNEDITELDFEEDFTALVEHLRMVSIHLFLELNEPVSKQNQSATSTNDDSVH
ncbi:MAG: UPF0149 family protein [Saccharospirillaceae bacterium]|nr:UPF0149 family protein [Pseudomonadales bacterium]NRB81847.1 UPF0149 family protein [Saccharospirillaceae bacterium]